MPRNLTDLMESAVASAPAEPHLAGDITQLAQHRQHRRTSFVAGAAALVVVAAAGGVVALRGGGHDATPEPVGPPVLMNQHQKLSEALSPGAASGFRILSYDAPSVLPAQGGYGALELWSDVDPQGRLLTARTTQPPTTATYAMVDGPGQKPRSVAAPAFSSLQPDGSTIPRWSFTGDGRLLWRNQPGSVLFDGRVTDLDGSGSVPLQESFDGIHYQGRFGIVSSRNAWVEGGRAWFELKTSSNDTLKNLVELVSLYSADLTDPQKLRAETPKDALEIDVSHGEAVWVDATGTKVFAEDLATGAQHQVPVPLLKGCQMEPPSAYFGESSRLVQTNGDLVAVNELCEGGEGAHVVVSDLSGSLVTEVDPGPGNSVLSVDLGESTLTFAALTPFTWYTDDLTTGQLVELGDVGSGGVHFPFLGNDDTTASRSAGRYVLWYDADGGHVGEFTG
jgi:hypothetical protein